VPPLGVTLCLNPQILDKAKKLSKILPTGRVRRSHRRKRRDHSRPHGQDGPADEREQEL
jgi:hypothetical protein